MPVPCAKVRPVTLAAPSSELCIEWQPSHSATPPEWKAYALLQASATATMTANLRNFILWTPAPKRRRVGTASGPPCTACTDSAGRGSCVEPLGVPSDWDTEAVSAPPCALGDIPTRA